MLPGSVMESEGTEIPPSAYLYFDFSAPNVTVLSSHANIDQSNETPTLLSCIHWYFLKRNYAAVDEKIKKIYSRSIWGLSVSELKHIAGDRANSSSLVYLCSVAREHSSLQYCCFAEKYCWYISVTFSLRTLWSLWRTIYIWIACITLSHFFQISEFHSIPHKPISFMWSINPSNAESWNCS